MDEGSAAYYEWLVSPHHRREDEMAKRMPLLRQKRSNSVLVKCLCESADCYSWVREEHFTKLLGTKETTSKVAWVDGKCAKTKGVRISASKGSNKGTQLSKNADVFICSSNPADPHPIYLSSANTLLPAIDCTRDSQRLRAFRAKHGVRIENGHSLAISTSPTREYTRPDGFPLNMTEEAISNLQTVRPPSKSWMTGSAVFRTTEQASFPRPQASQASQENVFAVNLNLDGPYVSMRSPSSFAMDEDLASYYTWLVSAKHKAEEEAGKRWPILQKEKPDSVLITCPCGDNICSMWVKEQYMEDFEKSYLKKVPGGWKAKTTWPNGNCAKANNVKVPSNRGSTKEFKSNLYSDIFICSMDPGDPHPAFLESLRSVKPGIKCTKHHSRLRRYLAKNPRSQFSGKVWTVSPLALPCAAHREPSRNFSTSSQASVAPETHTVRSDSCEAQIRSQNEIANTAKSLTENTPPALQGDEVLLDPSLEYPSCSSPTDQGIDVKPPPLFPDREPQGSPESLDGIGSFPDDPSGMLSLDSYDFQTQHGSRVSESQSPTSSTSTYNFQQSPGLQDNYCISPQLLMATPSISDFQSQQFKGESSQPSFPIEDDWDPTLAESLESNYPSDILDML